MWNNKYIIIFHNKYSDLSTLFLLIDEMFLIVFNNITNYVFLLYVVISSNMFRVWILTGYDPNFTQIKEHSLHLYWLYIVVTIIPTCFSRRKFRCHTIGDVQKEVSKMQENILQNMAHKIRWLHLHFWSFLEVDAVLM